MNTKWKEKGNIKNIMLQHIAEQLGSFKLALVFLLACEPLSDSDSDSRVGDDDDVNGKM